MKRFSLLVICLLAITEASPLIAQSCIGGVCRPPAPSAPAEAPHPSVVRVINQQERERTMGSGTLVAVTSNAGLVVSCAHLFHEYRGQISVVFPSGQSFAARLLAIDERADLSALLIAAPNATPIALAAELPRVGDPLSSCGYGPDGRFVVNRGRALGYVSLDGRTHNVLELSGNARQGDSGGPIFNASQQLAGVLFGTDGRRVDGTHCGQIRTFLEPHQTALQAPSRELPDGQPAVAALSQQLGELVEKLGVLDRRHSELAQQVAAIASSPSPRCACDPSLADRVARLEQSPPANPVAAAEPRGPAGAAPAGNGWSLGLDAWIGGKVTALLIGVGLPGSLAGIATWFLLRRGRKRVAQVAERVVIHHQAPPSPQIVERSREFVEVQVPTERQTAIEWAMDEYVKRNPGARPTVETIESYAKQFQSANKKP